MKCIVLHFTLFLCLAASGIAQTAIGKGSIQGTIIDKENQLPLPGATVVLDGSDQGTTTESDGTFQLQNLQDGTYSITIRYIGYTNKQLTGISIADGSTTDIGLTELEEEAIRLDEVTVTPGSFSIMGTENLSRQTLTAEDLKNMSWAEDITRAVARLPGVSSSDYSSKFAIRGGEADEVLITLDGMELYEPFHQRDYSGGLFSIVDIETVQSVELLTGGFSAEHGNRLSGAFNMKTKHIANNERHASVGLSVMNARVYADGKFADNKGSYIFSARRGMLDLAFKAIGYEELLPIYYDGMAKVEYALSPKHFLSLHVLHAGDRSEVNNSPEGDSYDQYLTKYRNTYSWLTLKSFYNPKLYSRTILYGGNINQDRSGGFDKYENTDKGSVRLADRRDYTLFGIKQDWNWQASSKLHLRAGLEAKQVAADYKHTSSISELRVNSQEQLFQYERSLDIQVNPSGQQYGIYLSGRYKLLDRLIAETGIRYDQTTYTGDQNWSPRVSLAYAFSKNTFLRGAWGYYYQSQFINNLDVNNGNITFDPAELAKHYVLSFEHLFKNGISMRMEAYYKDLTHISPLWQNLRDHLELYPEARNDNAKVVFNGITSKGIELFLKYDQGEKISWWFSYALAKAEDDVKDIEFDGLLVKRTGKLPRLNDQRHTIYADVNYRLNKNWHFNLSWHFYQGWPRTNYTYRYQTLDNGDLHFYQVHQEYNGVKYPAYHRMDLRVNRLFRLRNSKITAFIHLVNLYNRENLKKFDLDTQDDNEELSVDEAGNYVPFNDDKYWLGFTPVIGFSWEF